MTYRLEWRCSSYFDDLRSHGIALTLIQLEFINKKINQFCKISVGKSGVTSLCCHGKVLVILIRQQGSVSGWVGWVWGESCLPFIVVLAFCAHVFI